MEPKIKSNGKVFKFKVKYRDGSFKITDNVALRAHCPGLLIDFYESHIHVNFNWLFIIMLTEATAFYKIREANRKMNIIRELNSKSTSYFFIYWHNFIHQLNIEIKIPLKYKRYVRTKVWFNSLQEFRWGAVLKISPSFPGGIHSYWEHEQGLLQCWGMADHRMAQTSRCCQPRLQLDHQFWSEGTESWNHLQ